MSRFKKLIGVLAVTGKGIYKVAKVQAIKTVEEAAAAGLSKDIIDSVDMNNFSKKDMINEFKHNLVREYLYPLAKKYDWTADELDTCIPALKVFYKKLKKAYYSQKKFRGGK